MMNASNPRWLGQSHKLAKLLCLVSALLPLALPARAQGLPTGRSDADIGSPVLAGSAAYANGGWTIIDPKSSNYPARFYRVRQQ